MSTIRLAFLTTDNRDHHRRYDLADPFFGPAPEALLKGLAGIPDIETHVISCTQKPMHSSNMIMGNIFFHSLHVPKWGWLRSGYLGCWRAVGAILKKLNPDVIHAHGTERDCAVSALGHSIPTVLTLHGNIRRVAKIFYAPPLSFWWLQARLEGLVIPRFDGVICLSNHAYRQVSRQARKTWIIPNAVDPSFFEIERRPAPPSKLLCVATISPLKNQLGLIHSLQAFPLKHPYELYFYGAVDRDSDYGRAFFAAIARSSNLFYGGVLDRAALAAELSKASVLILPTKEDNCPMVILEAQAAGVPVIASNIAGIPDLIKNGMTGLLTEPDSPVTMPQALEKLLGNKALDNQLSELGRKQALALFHPRHIANRHLEIYQSVLNASSRKK